MDILSSIISGLSGTDGCVSGFISKLDNWLIIAIESTRIGNWHLSSSALRTTSCLTISRVCYSV
jgi:hypothetical protein